VHQLTGVYHARGTLLGELRYVVGRALGTSHCALCDITHGSVRLKKTWTEATSSIPVPFDRVHLDERSPEVAAITDGVTPCVVAHTDDGVEVVLGPAELAACHGEPTRLVRELALAFERRGLTYPGAASPSPGSSSRPGPPP
jgi:hypothetical protein